MHFSVMVFGDDVEQQLAPFQETNMGPIAPEYMQKVDYTDDVRELFEAPQQYFLLSDGRYVGYGSAHHREPSGKIVLMPGAVAVEMSADEARSRGLGFPTLDDAAEHLGAEREGDRYFVEDNFNSHWDWWVIGGRWGSMLKVLPGCQSYTARPLEFDPEFARVLNQPKPEAWSPTPGYCDQARKMDVDWLGMAAEAGEKAGAMWDMVHSWTGGASWSSLAEVRTKFGDDAWHHYRIQPAIKAILERQQTLPPERQWWDIDDTLSRTREDYVAAAEASAGVTYAVVFNGEWFQSDDHADPADWNNLFRAILNRLPDETLVTVADCHV